MTSYRCSGPPLPVVYITTTCRLQPRVDYNRGNKRQWWLVIARRSRGSGATVNVAKGSVITALQSTWTSHINVQNVATLSKIATIFQCTCVYTQARSPLCVTNVAKLSAKATILQNTCAQPKQRFYKIHAEMVLMGVKARRVRWRVHNPSCISSPLLTHIYILVPFILSYSYHEFNFINSIIIYWLHQVVAPVCMCFCMCFCMYFCMFANVFLYVCICIYARLCMHVHVVTS